MQEDTQEPEIRFCIGDAAYLEMDKPLLAALAWRLAQVALEDSGTDDEVREVLATEIKNSLHLAQCPKAKASLVMKALRDRGASDGNQEKPQ